VVAEGDKNRKLTGVFALEAPPPPVPTPTPTREPVERAAKHGPPLVSWMLGGVGVAALGSSTYLGLTSKADLAALRRDCAPNCTDSQVNGVRDRMIVADVALGVGVVAIVAAAWIWLADAGHAQRPTRASSE
jgi:hypothetical protein